MLSEAKELKIVTRNRNKFLEAKFILNKYGIKVKQEPIELMEIQSDNLEEIAENKAKQALKKVKPPFATEDAGLFVKALNGFPGPYSSYVYRTIGCQGMIKLMKDVGDRSAKFISIVVYVDPKGLFHKFKGEISGRIALNPLGSKGFGFDPIFIPNELPNRTLAELSFEEKNKISHRFKAFSKLAKYIIGP